MTYKEWLEQHKQKKEQIIKKLNTDDIDKIVAYFDYDSMKQNEIDFCPLYKDGKKCHDMDKLNCYFCDCLYFEFDDNGLEITKDSILLSKCTLNLGSTITHDGKIHQDCSNCIVPHKKKFVKDFFLSTLFGQK